jgi:hypothetical protein
MVLGSNMSPRNSMELTGSGAVNRVTSASQSCRRELWSPVGVATNIFHTGHINIIFNSILIISLLEISFSIEERRLLGRYAVWFL